MSVIFIAASRFPNEKVIVKHMATKIVPLMIALTAHGQTIEATLTKQHGTCFTLQSIT
jgi:dihydroorotase